METLPQPSSEICEYSLSDKGIAAPLLVDLPHGGRIYPEDFKFSCPRSALELCEEVFIDELYSPATLAAGGVVVKANFPRTYVDPNRNATDIDNQLLDAPWPAPLPENARSHYGQGVIMRMTSAENRIYSSPLSHQDVEHRISHYYNAYHNLLGTWLERIYKDFGTYYHLDCHSMPSSSVAHFFPHLQPDFILGDLDGRSCSLDFRQAVADELREKGYRVSINQIYRGAEIVSRYGQPAWRRNSLQIEINRAIFMNEKTQEKSPRFDTVRKDLSEIILGLSALR